MQKKEAKKCSYRCIMKQKQVKTIEYWISVFRYPTHFWHGQYGHIIPELFWSATSELQFVEPMMNLNAREANSSRALY